MLLPPDEAHGLFERTESQDIAKLLDGVLEERSLSLDAGKIALQLCE